MDGWKQRGSGGGGGGGGGRLEPARRNTSDTGPLQSTSTNTHHSPLRKHVLLLQLPVLLCRTPQGAHSQTILRRTLGVGSSSCKRDNNCSLNELKKCYHCFPTLFFLLSCHGLFTSVNLTLTGRLFAGNAGSAFLFLPKQASDGRLDALFLGCFVEGVLAAAAAAGVAALTVLQAGQTVHQQGETRVRRRNVHNKNPWRG